MSSHDGPKTIRKDTAAYASLSFFTCQRARLTKETKTNPASARRPKAKASGGFGSQSVRTAPSMKLI
jgi:hypothetical protein